MKLAGSFIGLLLACMMVCAPVVAQASDSHSMLNEAANEVGDAALTTKVKAVLDTNKIARNYKIHVSSEKGTVTLSGHVGSPSNAAYIARVVESIHGVKEVNNRLATP